MNSEPNQKCRVLSLDGGGAKGFYTLGVLKEIEAMVKRPLCESFDLIFGTSTGGIIAALLALGYGVDDIHTLYREHVPAVMRARGAPGKSAALARLAKTVFGDSTFADVKTGVGIVATRWDFEKPMIFKGSVAQAHGRHATFVPGFGCTIADAVRASCSAYPFFEKAIVKTSKGDEITLIDGGYCANNPTLYAIADAVIALKKAHADLRVVSIGVGVYPEPKRWTSWLAKRFLSVQLLQKTLNVNTFSMEQLRTILFNDIWTVRINDTFERPEMATDLMESDLAKLNSLFQRGGESFAKHEGELKISALTVEEQASFNAGLVPGTYPYADYKAHVIAALVKSFGAADVNPDTKAVKIKANGTRRSADVVVATDFRRYYRGLYGPLYERGICFFTPSGDRIVNYPKKHSANCTTKHQATNSWFKPMVRILKNMRSRLITDGAIKAGSAPSYFLEGLLYNVPNDKFGVSYDSSFVGAINWILQAERTKLLCANEQYYLVRDSAANCWPCGNCESFLNALIKQWNEWS